MFMQLSKANNVAAAQRIQSCSAQKLQSSSHKNIFLNVENMISVAYNHGMFVDAIIAGWSLLKTTIFLGITHATVSREWR